jgi:hypothetical protein
MAVDDGCGRALADDLKIRDRKLDALLDPIIIDWFQAPDTVGIDASFIGRNQDLGADFSVFGRYSNPLKNIGHKTFQNIRLDVVYFAFHSGNSLQ